MTQSKVDHLPVVIQTSDNLLRRAGAVWVGRQTFTVASGLLLAATILLGLNATGTVQVGFTLSPSQVLAGLSVLVGAPAALRGWLRAPSFVLLPALGLLTVYALLVLTGTEAPFPGSSTRLANRDLVYLADIAIGLAVVGLGIELAHDARSLRRLAWFIIAGAALAAIYAIYQWLAQQFGWPFSDVNNSVNSDGFTRGDVFQGNGILGWERVRGTFKEPLFLGSYLACTLPIASGIWWSAGSRIESRSAACIVALLATGLFLTGSTLAWGALVLAVLAIGTLLACAARDRRAVRVFATLITAAAVIGPLAFVDPSAVSGLTGRTSEALRATSQNRLDAWERALDRWPQQPALGHGGGQSAVLLAYRPDTIAARREPYVLGSAQGLWAAALLDTGIVGLTLWAVLFVGIFVHSGRLVAGAWPERRTSEVLLASAFVGSLAAVLLGQLSADRFDIRVWILVALLMGAAHTASGRSPDEEDSQSSHPAS